LKGLDTLRSGRSGAKAKAGLVLAIMADKGWEA
jgi:hypothetical protein